MKTLSSDRLDLQPVTVENAAVLWRIMQTSRLREYQDVPRFSRDDFTRRVAARPTAFDARTVGRYEWLIVAREGGSPIGWVSLRVGDHALGTAEVGYSLIAGQRARGFATEAVRAVVAYAFEASDLRQLDACCVPANVASRRLLSRLGFAEMRVQRNGAIVRGRPVDIVIFELARERWDAAQAGSENSIVIPASARQK